MAVISLSSFSVRADEVADVQKLLSAGKNVEAMQKADQFLSSKPKDPMMRFLRGISLSQAGRTAEAVTAFQKLTEDYPELPEPFNNLAVLYAQQGQYDKSRTALEMAIRTNPSYATAYENLGDVYAKLASQAYSKALQIDTRSAVAPKLAMIRDLFPKDRNGATAVAAANTGNKPSTSMPVAPPTVPVVTPAAVKPPVAATPAAIPPPVAAPASDAQEKAVEAALRTWAAAWSAKDVDGYIEAYSDDFKGDKGSRKAWEQERRERINSKRKISVNLSDIDVSVNGNKASARFRQAYKADSLDISSGKRIDLVRVGNEWVIVKESSGS
jgi:tetratricopeptide (TPR) repeat protein